MSRPYSDNPGYATRHSYDVDLDPESDEDSASENDDSNLRARARNTGFGSGGFGSGSYRDSPDDDDSVKESAMANARRFLIDGDDDSHSPDASGGFGARTTSGRLGNRRDPFQVDQRVNLMDMNRSGMPTNLSGTVSRKTKSRGGIMGMFRDNDDVEAKAGTHLSGAAYRDGVYNDAAGSAPEDMEEYLASKHHRTVPVLGSCLHNRRIWCMAVVAVVVVVLGLHLTGGADEGVAPKQADTWENHVDRERYEKALGNMQTDNILTEETNAFMTLQGTPQNKALRWVVAQDPLKLDVSSEEFRLRYLYCVIYYGTGGEKTWKADKSKNWLTEKHVCDWDGVSCNTSQEPLQLNLTDFGCSGPLPLEVLDLDVDTLDLTNNRLEGSLPRELGKSNIVNLILGGNLFVGAIPPELSRSQALRKLSLENNRLSGTLPLELAMQHPPKMTTINLGGNNLKGRIPDFSIYTDMEYLMLDRNELSGPVHKNLGVLSNLRELRLNQNHLTGTIPRSLTTMSNLKILDLSENKIHGHIPDIIASLFNLQELILFDNNLTGNLPVHLLDDKNHMLRDMQLQKNKLSGGIAPGIRNLVALRTLRFDDNGITGPIPKTFAEMTELEELRLNDNEMTGQIPSELGAMTKLERLHLEHNGLKGFIPSELGGMVAMQSLRVHENRLTGSMPNQVCDIPGILYISANCDGKHAIQKEPYVECECCTRCF